MKIIRFLFTMIGCAALVQNTGFAALASQASDGKSAAEMAGNLPQSKSGADAKKKLVENKTTQKRAPALHPQSVVPPAGRSLINAPNRGSSAAIIGGPAVSKKNAVARIGGTADTTKKMTVINGTAMNHKP